MCAIRYTSLMTELFDISIPAIHIHLITLAVTAVCILIADHEAYLWVRGKKVILSLRKMRTLHMLVSIGLTLMILSGALLAWPMLDYLVEEESFWVKMAFVLLLVVNSFVIGSMMGKASEKPFAELSKKERGTLFVSGAASALGWGGAFLAALAMTTSEWLEYFFELFFDTFLNWF
jgi:hypothetical protein